MPFEIQARQGIVVWLYSLRQAKQLKKYGLVYYTSTKGKYSYLYVNQEAVAQTIEQLKKLRFVKRVSVSRKPEIEMNFAENLQKLANKIEKGE